MTSTSTPVWLGFEHARKVSNSAMRQPCKAQLWTELPVSRTATLVEPLASLVPDGEGGARGQVEL